MKASFKPLDLDDCTLHPSRIDIWQYPLDIDYPFANDLLSSEETLRANRYLFSHHRQRFIAAHTALRLILSRYCQIPAHQLVFDQGLHGKPFLINAPALQFNLSHSRNTALLAVGYNHPMGIDLEFFTDRPYQGIADNLFSPIENQSFKNTHPRLKALAFFHVWAQKEALIKACGLGLQYPTQQFNVMPLATSHQTILDTLHHQTWQMATFHPHIGCYAALCYHLAINEIRYLVLPPNYCGLSV